MAYRIVEIEGIGPAHARRLAGADIHTTACLLAACSDRKGRRTVSGTTGLSERQLLKWANMADLMRVPGIGQEFSELLEAAGVDTVKALRNRNPANLAAKMAEVNCQRRLTRRVPSDATVARWIASARGLPPLITH